MGAAPSRTAREQLVQWVERSSGFDDLQFDKALRVIEQLTDKQCATLMALSVERRRKKLNAAIAQGSNAITIRIYDPDEKPDVYNKTFQNEDKFEKWLTRGSIAHLFKDGKEPSIDDYSALTPGGYYTFTLLNMPDGVKNFEQHKAHAIARGKQEFACAIIEDLLENDGIEAVQLTDECVVTDEQGNDAAETDVVVGFADGAGYILGSMKSYVSGVSDVDRLQKKIREHYEQHKPFVGKPVQPAFMLEAVTPGLFQKLKDTCHKRNVRLYTRNGRSISRVQMRASMWLLGL